MSEDKESREHPSYGMVGLSRQTHSGGTRLFGSSLDNHYSSVRIAIKRATWQHDMQQDRYYAKEHLIDVTVSSAQFAEMITNMNCGDGVPCTIGYIQAEGMIERPPEVLTEVQRIKANFGDSLQAYAERTAKYRAEVNALTDKLPAKSKEKIRIALDCMEQTFTGNIQFIAEQLNDASDKVVTAAKQEIEAFATNVVRSAGLEAIADGNLPKMLSGTVK